MADAPTTSPQPAAPPPAGPSRSEAFLNAAKGFGKKLVAFLSTTTVALLGFAVILLTWGAVLADKHFAHLSAVAGPIADHVASWPFLFTGIGLLLVAKSRAMVRDNYAAEAKKTKGEYPHAWKIPLIGTQSLALNLLAFYALGVGIRLWPRLHNVILLLLLFLAFLTYLFWYVTAHFVNRFPKAAGLRIAVMALVLALLAAFAMSQVLLIGLILALFALLAALVSISVSPFSSPEGRVWIRALCLFGAIGLLVPTAYHYFFGGESQVKLIELNPAVKGLTGEVGALAYSPDGQRLAFSVKKDR
ncbi:MAG TPA: hypothetical protein VFR02_07645, partial [bacterium]|nr:hypothetical protein [bacterium]